MKVMEKVIEIISDQESSVHTTEEKFESIASSIDDIRKVLRLLNGSSLKMNENKEKIIELTQNLSAISEENAAGTEEASAAIEEQAATINEIAASGEKLQLISNRLKELIEKFKI